ncbi:hypothetical protein GL218_08607 [Daldinia childiae]|uniref:uncharacterized protein n=1 Tax=Daldinia childiae TaxID=326645 RepID=UPI00144848AD|nr:uncharacterized protein GL218_08607 [Daldinia childiae]KAF3067270.1 hypothetical protein GL218_08607 [Daldinia childiae]
MNWIRRSVGTALVVVGGGGAYLTMTTNLISTLPADDNLWSSRSFVHLNRHRNPAIQDYVWKRLPLSKVRPDLRDDEEAIATEFCRGVWAGYAYIPQRILTTLSLKSPKTIDQLFDQQQLASSKYDLGVRFSDQFEVMERTSNSVTIRAGGSPLEPGPREFDGILILSAKVNKEDRTVEVGIKTAFFNSVAPVRDGKMPSPFVVELLHRYYARALVDSGVRRLTRSSP